MEWIGIAHDPDRMTLLQRFHPLNAAWLQGKDVLPGGPEFRQSHIGDQRIAGKLAQKLPRRNHPGIKTIFQLSLAIPAKNRAGTLLPVTRHRRTERSEIDRNHNISYIKKNNAHDAHVIQVQCRCPQRQRFWLLQNIDNGGKYQKPCRNFRKYTETKMSCNEAPGRIGV